MEPENQPDKTSRTLRLLSDCNDALIRLKDEIQLLHSVCRLIVDKGGYPFAWVGYAGLDEDKTIEPVAYFGVDKTHGKYLKQARISWGDDLSGSGPAGNTIKTGKTQMVKNMFADINFEPWKKEAEKRGFTSVLTLPLTWEDSVKGVLVIYAPQETAFDQEEIKLLERLSDNLSYGIQSIHNNWERIQAEKLLSLENRVYQLTGEDLREEDYYSKILHDAECILSDTRFLLILLDDENKQPDLVVAPSMDKPCIDAFRDICSSGDPDNAESDSVLIQEEVNDVNSDTLPVKYRDLFLQQEIKSCYSAPLTGTDESLLGFLICCRSRPLPADNISRSAFISISHIITNAVISKHALFALKESQERFQLLSLATLDGIYDWNMKAGKLWTNETFRKSFGMVNGDLNELGWKALMIHPDDSGSIIEGLNERIEQKSKMWVKEYRHLKKNGSYANVLERGYIIYDQDGNPARMIGVIMDITARKKAEWEIRESGFRFQSLYDDSPSMFLTLSPDGSIISVNKFGAQHLGHSVQEVVGKSILDLCVEEDKGIIMDKIISCVSSPGDVFRCEFGIQHKYEDIIWVRATLRLIRYSEDDLSVLMTCEDISEARLLSEQLEHQAKHDSLTGLINRAEFERRLRRIITSETGDEEHSLCYLDLDQFKVINDTCGHLAGDELIRQVSEILSKGVRKRDTLARLGGDEFAILMEHCPLSQASRVARDLLKAISNFRFVWEGKRFGVGVSIGVVPINEGKGSVNNILSVADAACYAAKDAGRNRIHVYEEDDDELSRRRGEMQWVAKINNALEEDRFCLAAQDIVFLGNEEDRPPGKHYELLIRMRDEDGSIITPGIFLPAAERYNLSVKLDRWVVTTVFDWLTTHPTELEELDTCSINLSGHTLGDDSFLKMLLHKFMTGAVPPAKICFEITETAAVANLRDAIQFIQELKKIGCQFSLDDFGTGLSSFNYLKNLPVDYLKIDGSFVREIHKNPIDLTMVRSINELGKVMGKKTIAEFVENREILAILEEIGVDFAQGYAVGMPELLPI